MVDQWDLWGQTDCHGIPPCMLPKTQFGRTAPHLYFTCLNPDEDRDSREMVEEQQREGISSSINVCCDFTQHFLGASK